MHTMCWVLNMKKNYLSKVPAAPDSRANKRFKCKAVVRLVYKQSVKRPLAACRAVIVDISQAGAVVSGTFTDVPDYFYIVIGNFEYAIGCVVVRKEKNHMAVEFIKEQPRRLVEAFALLSFPMAPLFSMRGLMKNEIVQASATEALGKTG